MTQVNTDAFVMRAREIATTNDRGVGGATPTHLRGGPVAAIAQHPLISLAYLDEFVLQ